MSDPPAPEPDSLGLHMIDLSPQECLDRLVLGSVGRLGLSVASLPVIFPVNYAVDGEVVVFCTGAGTKLEAAATGNVACLEIDDFDAVDHVGWSVLVTGRLRVVDQPDEVAALHRLPVAPWRRIHDPRYVELTMDLLSGRRLQLADHA